MRSFLPKASNTIPLKNLNYLQAKEGGAETRKLPPISQIGGFRSRSVQGEQSKLIWSDFCTCLINNNIITINLPGTCQMPNHQCEK